MFKSPYAVKNPSQAHEVKSSGRTKCVWLIVLIYGAANSLFLLTFVYAIWTFESGPLSANDIPAVTLLTCLALIPVTGLVAVRSVFFMSLSAPNLWLFHFIHLTVVYILGGALIIEGSVSGGHWLYLLPYFSSILVVAYVFNLRKIERLR